MSPAVSTDRRGNTHTNKAPSSTNPQDEENVDSTQDRVPPGPQAVHIRGAHEDDVASDPRIGVNLDLVRTVIPQVARDPRAGKDFDVLAMDRSVAIDGPGHFDRAPRGLQIAVYGSVDEDFVAHQPSIASHGRAVVDPYAPTGGHHVVAHHRPDSDTAGGNPHRAVHGPVHGDSAAGGQDVARGLDSDVHVSAEHDDVPVDRGTDRDLATHDHDVLVKTAALDHVFADLLGGRVHSPGRGHYTHGYRGDNRSGSDQHDGLRSHLGSHILPLAAWVAVTALTSVFPRSVTPTCPVGWRPRS